MKTLTIAIPTYNRAEMLNKQIEFLFESQVTIGIKYNIIVNDNFSHDETEIICKNWIERAIDLDINFNYFKNDSNIGLVRNIIKCFENSTTELVWVIGDDDEIFTESLKRLLIFLNDPKNEIYDFYHLNYRVTDGVSRKILMDSFYNTEKKYLEVKDCLKDRLQIDAFMFITANIVSRQPVLSSVASWTNGSNLLAFPLYFYLLSGLAGNFILFNEPVFNGIYNVGSWKKYASRVLAVEIPIILLKLKNKEKIDKKITMELLNKYTNLYRFSKECVKSINTLKIIVKAIN